MAYVTGTANSLTDLLSAIQGACTGNGWTLSGDVLHKGTCYAEVKVSDGRITIRSGTGVDGNNALTGATDRPTGRLGADSPRYGKVGSAHPAFVFPVTYFVHIHASPDEVYIVCRYAQAFYQTIAWGQSMMPGLAGTGNWYGGPNEDGRYYGFGTKGRGEASTSTTCTFALLLSKGFISDPAHGVDHRLDINTWNVEGAWRDWATIAARQPNSWNEETILHPIRVYARRPSGMVSPVLECAHARYVNLANLQDGQIVTLGSDRWKVYPFWHRNTPYVDFRPGLDSGTFGQAIRYDGP